MQEHIPVQAWCMTLDSDWAPQFVIDHVLSLIREYGIPATLFCTSAYTLPNWDRLDVGTHPNFMRGSTHGTTEEGCLSTVRALYPAAVGSRSHSYYWHSGLYSLLKNYGYLYDSSMLYPFQSHLAPSRQFGLVRFPVWCGDNLLMQLFPNASTFSPPDKDAPGLKVCNFHPIHIYLNSRSMDDTHKALGDTPVQHTDQSFLSQKRRAGNGMEKVFIDALRFLRNESVYTLAELV